MAPDGTADGTSFGAELRRLRRAEGKSLAQLADVLRTSKGYLSRLENGHQRPSAQFARACDAALKAGGALMALAAAPVPDVCPYPGLTSFRTEDARWFFGRDRAVADLLGLLADPRTAGHPAVVIGPSGIGKTSLLRAGLAAAAARGALPERQPGSGVLYLTPTARPLDEWRSHDRQQALESYALVMVDQFEELFTLCGDPQERDAFIGDLCGRAADGLPVVLGVRADFYGHCVAHPSLLASLRDRVLPLGPMTVPELRQAIAEPAAAAGLTLEPGLVEVLLRDLGSAPGSEVCPQGALPLLSHALRATWQHRQDGVLTVVGYERTGGIHGAVAATAERVYARLSPEEQDAAQGVMLSMVRVGDNEDDVRQPADRDALVQADPAAEGVVEAFTRARLLTVDADQVQVSHEALLRAWPRLREWIDSDRVALRAHQQLTTAARTWAQEGQDPHLLYRGTRLAAALELIARRRMGPHEGEFVRASVQQQDADQRAERTKIRRLRRLTAALAVLSLLAVALAVIAVHQGTVARDQTAHAQSLALSAAAADARGRGLSETAQLLALGAVRLDDGAATARGALLSTQGDLLKERLAAAPGEHGRLTHVLAANDRTLATYDREHHVQLWDLATHKPVGPRLDSGNGSLFPLSYLKDFAISRDGQTVAVGKQARLWVWRRGVSRTFSLTAPVAALALRPDGRQLAVATLQGCVTVTGLDPAGARPYSLTCDKEIAQGLAYSPDGTRIATAGQRGTLTVRDAADGRLRNRRHVPGANLLSVAFSPDSRRIAAVGHDNLAILWQPEQDRTKVLTTPVTGSALTAVAFSPDGAVVATAGDDLQATLWSVSRELPMLSITGHTEPVRAVGFTDHGRTLVTTSEDGTTALWDLTRGPLPDAHGSQQETVTYVRGGHAFVASGGETPRVWTTGRARTYLGAFPAQQGIVYRTAANAAGTLLATAGWDGSVQLWNTTTRTHERTLLPVNDTGTCGLAVSRSGNVIAAGDSHGTLHIWNRSGKELHRPIHLSDGAICAVAISPHDEHRIAFGDDVNQIHQLDLTSPAAPILVGSHTDSIRSLAFNHHGTRLASAGDDHKVKVWDVTGRRPRLAHTLAEFTAAVRTVAYSSDDTLLAAAGRDTTIRIWKTTAYEPYAILTGHQNMIESLAFHPHRNQLASAALDGTVRLWDLTPDTVRALVCSTLRHAGPTDWTHYARSIPQPDRCA
ncbi:helix-turn-helix domain-containing protein [Streptomyces sp. NPDC053069]|uniref:nSTAND1 domain-containing NTPase n=1 Tax=Streptomyces sp. NPDC053069 TaxID=3365695 RepID=UPI0037D35778